MDAFYPYWAKTAVCNDKLSWHLLPYHSLDVAACGLSLQRLYLSHNKQLNNQFHELLGFTQLFPFFLAIHDLGKFSESFQNLNPEVFYKLQGRKSNKEYPSRHDKLGWLMWGAFVRKHLLSKHNCNKNVMKLLDLWASISLGHHGKPINAGSMNSKIFYQVYSARVDIKEAVLPFIDAIIDIFKIDFSVLADALQDRDIKNKQIQLFKNMSWALSGIFVLSDWLGSNSEIFHFVSDEVDLKEYWKEILPLAESAVVTSGMIPAKRAVYGGFYEVFPQFDEPNGLQEILDNVDLPDKAQLWIFESLTGSGKTEAAVTLASRLLSREVVKGVFFALPTMATSNSMYDRLSSCYTRLFDETSQPSLILAHGMRKFSEKFKASIFPEISDNNKEEFEHMKHSCSAWLSDTNKKALLGDIGVGTIDQVLLGTLPIRYQNLRILGLHEKLLIVDEVHSYDPYMNTLLKNLLKWHAKNGGTAVLLSATLPKIIRDEYCQAYSIGLEQEAIYSILPDDYPLVTCISATKSFCATPERDVPNVKIKIDLTDSDDDITDLIIESAKNGKCVCWIRNTINDLFDGYNKIKELDPNIDILAFHSRYTIEDRNRIEQSVLNTFGKSSGESERTGKVLIATQVVEQSLDLDFDVLISDLAPIDLLIQRAGRLCRHKRDKTGNLICDSSEVDQRGMPVLTILTPVGSPESKNWYKDKFSGGAFVYPNTAQLWLTQQVLVQEKFFNFPERARYVIEEVYGYTSFDIPECLQESEIKGFSKSLSDKSFADLNTIPFDAGYSLKNTTAWCDEESVSTRLGGGQTKLFLFVRENKKVVPISKKTDIEFSQISLYHGFFKKLQHSNLSDVELNEIRKKFFRINDQDYVFVLEKDNEKHVAELQTDDGKAVFINYSNDFGLKVIW